MTTELLGEIGKAEGMAKVITNDPFWYAKTMVDLGKFLLTAPDTFTMDTFRAWRTEVLKASEPKNPNVWGALWGSAAKRKMIKPAGGFVKSSNPASHARAIMIWTRA